MYEFNKGELVEVMTKQFEKSHKIKFGEPVRIEAVGFNQATIKNQDGRMLNIYYKFLRRPRCYREEEFFLKKKLNSAAFKLLVCTPFNRKPNIEVYEKLNKKGFSRRFKWNYRITLQKSL